MQERPTNKRSADKEEVLDNAWGVVPFEWVVQTVQVLPLLSANKMAHDVRNPGSQIFYVNEFYHGISV